MCDLLLVSNEGFWLIKGGSHDQQVVYCHQNSGKLVTALCHLMVATPLLISTLKLNSGEN